MRALVRCRQPFPPRPLPHKRTAPVRMRRVPPKRRVLCYCQLEPAHESPHRQIRLHVNSPVAHGCKAVAEAVIDIIDAVACSGSRCSSL